MNIYQIFTRLFRVDNGLNIPFGTIGENGCSKFNHFTDRALDELSKFGITHIWFTGIIRHASCTSYSEYGLLNDNRLIVKGVAGSPYAIKDYFDVDPDLADDVNNRMNEFERLISRCHKKGLKVIIDFVPNHVSRQYCSQNRPSLIDDIGTNDVKNQAFNPNNNFYYLEGKFIPPIDINLPYTADSQEYIEEPAKATGNNVFVPKPTILDWYETVKLNYGVDYSNNTLHFDPIPDTWLKMFSVLNFWADKGVDAFRVDMAEMVPIEFWNWVIERIKVKFPDIQFIAEVYNPMLYSSFIHFGGFDYLYDKEQFYNIVRNILTQGGTVKQLTSCWQQQEGLGKYMLRFIENHDEQRVASEQFCGNPLFAVPAMTVAATMNQGGLMIYFGQEIGECAADSEGFSGYDGRTTIFDYWRVTEYQKWVDKGRFSESKLSIEQRQLRHFYSNLLNIRKIYSNVLSASFFDLMYVNQHNLDADRIFAFLRHGNGAIMLVVANFDCYNAHSFSLYFPKHCFDLMSLGGGVNLEFTDVLNRNLTLFSSVNSLLDDGLQLTVEPHGSYIFDVRVL